MARRYSRRSGYYRSGYSSYSRRNRRREERMVEVVTFGLIIVLFILQLVSATAFNTQIILLLGGFLLLGSAVYQSSRRWRVNPMTWFGGGAMLLCGVLALQTGVVPFGLGPLLPLLIFGAVIAASFITGEF